MAGPSAEVGTGRAGSGGPSAGTGRLTTDYPLSALEHKQTKTNKLREEEWCLMGCYVVWLL
jgi:hypothetical protein